MTSASPPAPNPTYQVNLVAVAAHPSPPAMTVGGTVGEVTAAGVAVAAAPAAATGVSVAAGAAAAGVSVGAGTAVAVDVSPPQADSRGKSITASAATQLKRDFNF